MNYLLRYSIFENLSHRYGHDKDTDIEFIKDMFLEYSDKWDLDPTVIMEHKGRYLMKIEFETYDEENDTILKSKVVTDQDIKDLKKDIEIFVNRIRKYAFYSFSADLTEEDFKQLVSTSNWKGAIWVYIDFGLVYFKEGHNR